MESGLAPCDFVQSPEGLSALIRRLQQAQRIAFDTEFVSEGSYKPQLCLIQIATDDLVALIDPFVCGDLGGFWSLLTDGSHETIVHAGREESCFALDATGKFPANLCDVQLAAGFTGLEYPAGYGTLIHRLLGKQPQKEETRTDWRRRPLSSHQVDYAAEDVRFLLPLKDSIWKDLHRLDRTSWLEHEMHAWQQAISHSRGVERWRRVSGSTTLSRRSLAIIRQLWNWREAEGQKRNMPVRRVLRDDLLVELARRRTADLKRIRAVRGMERGDLQKLIPQIAQHVELALQLPDDECPEVAKQDYAPQTSLVTQLLSVALASVCRAQRIAPSIVGTAQDVRDLVAYRMADPSSKPRQLPALMEGWRATVVGGMLDDLLAGKCSVRIEDPLSDEPLAFDPTRPTGQA